MNCLDPFREGIRVNPYSRKGLGKPCTVENVSLKGHINPSLSCSLPEFAGIV